MSTATNKGEPEDPLLLMHSMPGHLIRRAKQKTTQAFAPIAQRFNLTPIQYSVLKAIALHPGADQTSLGELIGLDASTVGEVILRLEQRGLVQRTLDGRRQLLGASAAATQMLKELAPMLVDAQEHTMSALTKIEKKQFLRLLSKMVGVTNIHYQPRRSGRRSGAASNSA
jgi:DNA-binding MarR family transcriptional regulator